MTKYARVVITAIIAVIIYSTVAFAANHTILKTTGIPIAIPSYNAGDTLIITGDALEGDGDGAGVGPDWPQLSALTTPFALKLQNAQTEIPYRALYNADELTLLDLSGAVGIKNILNEALLGAQNLVRVDLTGLTQLETIGSYAFNSCVSLEEVTMDGLVNLHVIGNNAFQGCSNLKSFDFRQLKDLTLISDAAFDQCTSLTNVDLSGLSELEVIESTAFYDCTGIKTINLLNGPKLSAIGIAAFYGATSLEYLVVDRDPPAFLGPSALDEQNDSPIYVPLHLVNAYKTVWSAYEHRIQPLEAALPPVATPAGGTYSVAQQVTLASATPNATIYYTLDGSDPITNPNGTRVLYTGGFTVVMGTTLKAFALSSITTPSPVMTEVYTQGGGGGGKVGTVATPIATPPGGIYDRAQTVTLTSATPGATIYYTLDCSDPRTSPTRQKYTTPIIIPMGTMLKAYAVKSGMYDSALLIQCYTQAGTVAMPIASPPGGLFSSAQTVYLSSETPDTVIYYTLDGSDPGTNPNGTRQTYSKPLHIPLGTTLKAYAEKGGLLRSAVLTETYTLYNESCGSGGGCNGGISAASLGLLLAGAVLLGKKKR